jgi:hypothetical protein
MDSRPILTKIVEATKIIAKGCQKQQQALSDQSILLQGTDGCYMHVDYDTTTAGIILHFVGNDNWDTITSDRYSGRETPSWGPQKDMKCHAKLLQQLNSFIYSPEKGQLSLLETMMFVSKVRPAQAQPATPEQNPPTAH